MRAFENKITEIPDTDKEGTNTNYSGLCAYVLNIMPEGGYSIDEMEARLRIKAVTGKANGTIKLEDADYSKLNELVQASKWPMLHQDVINFKKDVANAKKVK